MATATGLEAVAAAVAVTAGPHLANIAFRERRRARLAEDGARAL